MPKNFTWTPGSNFPNIEAHSSRKLEVIKRYLDVYFDTVVRNPAIDRLNITLVDGFCGGGKYQNGQHFEFGSPLILLKAVEAAKKRLNEVRSKPLEINARFHFIDEERDHIEMLRHVLAEEGYGDRIDQDIKLVTSEFTQNIPNILEEINTTQRAGRSIFVLDQLGYSDVPMRAIQSIFQELDRPEVLLTFAIDSFLNYLQESSADLPLYKQYNVDRTFIAEWKRNKTDEAFGRLITQRMLMSNIQLNSGAEFFTPFMLWSKTDNRWMMLAHLSRHQAARDKMLGVHWEMQNSFRHIGKGSLYSLGFDTRLIESRDSLFCFSDQDKLLLGTELLAELPAEIRALMVEDRVTVDTILSKLGNRTAATNDDLFAALKVLSTENEYEVYNASGTLKRPRAKITLRDQLVLSSQRRLFKF